MSAKGRFDPEQLLADARGGRREALGKALELNRTNLALWARAQIGLRLQGASMPPISFRRHSWMPAATSTTFAAPATASGLPGCARSCATTWPALSRGKSTQRNGAPGGKHHWTDMWRQWSGRREQARSRPRLSAHRARPAARPGAANAPPAFPISWLDCPLTTVKCSSCGTWKGCRSPRWPAAWAGLPEPCRILWVRAVDQLRRLLQAEELL